jgi:uncharacterized protein (TIGR04141 family)
MFEGDTGSTDLDPSRLRSVDAKRVSADAVRMRHQTARKAVLEAFDIDLNRDFLNGVTGQPLNAETWGPQVTGRDALYFDSKSRFEDLSGVCHRLPITTGTTTAFDLAGSTTSAWSKTMRPVIG